MRTRSLPLAFIAVLLLAFGAIVAACGGGGEPLTLEEYFRRFEVLSDELDERSEAPEEQFDEQTASTDSEEGLIDALRDFFRASRPLLVDYLDGIDELTPPEQAQDAHNEILDTGRDLLAAFDNFFDRLEDVESSAALEELFEEDSFVDTGERFEEACLVLQEIARENDIDVDLRCEG